MMAEIGSIKHTDKVTREVHYYGAVRVQPGNHQFHCDHAHDTHSEAITCAQALVVETVQNITGATHVETAGELRNKPWADQGMLGVPTFFNLMDLHPYDPDNEEDEDDD